VEQAPPAFSRHWAFASSKTFTIKPIKDLLHSYLTPSVDVVDPFARDSVFGTCTNDINPATSADYHMDAPDFLAMLVKGGEVFDAALLDPPYSSRQIIEHYAVIGRRPSQQDTQRSPTLNICKDHINQLLRSEGIVISCGWNSNGMGLIRGYTIIEIMLVAHGGARNDTIVTVERKKAR
jgi:hypothetical protein